VLLAVQELEQVARLEVQAQERKAQLVLLVLAAVVQQMKLSNAITGDK
jgi:hypothetical protein